MKRNYYGLEQTKMYCLSESTVDFVGFMDGLLYIYIYITQIKLTFDRLSRCFSLVFI